MKKKPKTSFIKTHIYLVLGWFMGWGSITVLAEEKTPPNVLFIAVDDLNDWVGYLGGHPQAHTPNIDALAAEAVAFKYAYSPAPVCGPCRTALMYGISPHKSGSYGHDKLYRPSERFSEKRLPMNLVFQNNGYYTAGCGKIFHFAESRGWDVYGRVARVKVPCEKETLGNIKFGIQQTDNDSDTGDGKLADWAIQQLALEHEKPFFIALGLNRPHMPWEAPKKYFEKFDLESIELPSVPKDDLDDLSDAGRAFAKSIVGFRAVDDHETILKVPGAWKKLIRAYLASCSFADANVGRVLDALKKSEYGNNTIVVLWGDHGWHLGEKSHWRKMTLWERGTRTPFIIKVPGTRPGKVEAPVSLQDIFPTLVELCGLKVEQELDGNSLKSLIKDPSLTWNKPVLMSHGPGNFAVRQGPWRLIRYAGGSEEMYQLEIDPGEHTNLASDPKNMAKRDELRRYLPKSWQYVMGPRFLKFAHLFAKPGVDLEGEVREK